MGAAASGGTSAQRSPWYRRLVGVYLTLLALLLLAVVPPTIHVNRFKKRIVTSISTTLGRPVHLDRVSLNLLPFPGFTLENFVVEEDAAFGAEPIMRANTVRVRLRASSLWRGKVEFSTISLDEPSLNVVENAAGRWNFEGILQQAGQIPAAPTEQRHAGAAPRFPYIEATGARINVKQGLEKLPYSLTDADLALWLPEAGEWHVRMAGHPTRTDTGASDTGSFDVEGLFRPAAHFVDTPFALTAAWRHAPLGEASLVLLGRDTGLRGELAVTVEMQGTAEQAAVKSRVEVRGVRRAEFVPAHAIDLDVECQATEAERFRAYHAIQCSWPPAETPEEGLTLGLRGRPRALAVALTGDVPDVQNLRSASIEIGTPGLPAETLLDWLYAASARVPAQEKATGVLTAKLALGPEERGARELAGSVGLEGATVTGGALGGESVALGDLELHSNGGGFTLGPTSLSLATAEKVQPERAQIEKAQIEGRFDRRGYVLHLTGNVLPSRLQALGRAVPQFGDGMEAVLGDAPAAGPVRLDVTIERPWGGAQRWSRDATQRPTLKGRRRRGK